MTMMIRDPENLIAINTISIRTNYNFTQYTNLAVLNDYKLRKITT